MYTLHDRYTERVDKDTDRAGKKRGGLSFLTVHQPTDTGGPTVFVPACPMTSPTMAKRRGRGGEGRGGEGRMEQKAQYWTFNKIWGQERKIKIKDQKH